jgi:hypothetical protein
VAHPDAGVLAAIQDNLQARGHSVDAVMTVDQLIQAINGSDHDYHGMIVGCCTSNRPGYGIEVASSYHEQLYGGFRGVVVGLACRQEHLQEFSVDYKIPASDQTCVSGACDLMHNRLLAARTFV